jgi:DUF917 family protein
VRNFQRVRRRKLLSIWVNIFSRQKIFRIVEAKGIQVSRLKYLGKDEYKKIRELVREWARRAKGLVKAERLVRDKTREVDPGQRDGCYRIIGWDYIETKRMELDFSDEALVQRWNNGRRIYNTIFRK